MAKYHVKGIVVGPVSHLEPLNRRLAVLRERLGAGGEDNLSSITVEQLIRTVTTIPEGFA